MPRAHGFKIESVLVEKGEISTCKGKDKHTHTQHARKHHQFLYMQSKSIAQYLYKICAFTLQYLYNTLYKICTNICKRFVQSIAKDLYKSL